MEKPQKPRKPRRNASRSDWGNYYEALERYEDQMRLYRDLGGSRESNWSEPMGGGDSEGNPLTVSFGSGPAEGETLLGDGDRGDLSADGSHYLFHESRSHNHYGSGDGPNENVRDRGQYTGEGH